MIVNISSLHAQNGQSNASLYAASKGAVMAFTKSLARKGSKRNSCQYRCSGTDRYAVLASCDGRE